MSNGDDVQITSVIDANGQPLPLHGTSIGGNYGPPVKQERPDDAEIRELAAKMREQQKQQAAQQASRQAAMQHTNGSAGVGSGGGGHGGGGGGAVMQPPLTNGNGQTNIMSYLSRHQKLPNGTMQVVPALASNGRANGVIDSEKGSQKGSSAGPCDEESIKGHFGWAQFSKVSIPYIYRLSEKYCSVRMIELKLLGKYLNCLHPDIYSSCTCVRSYYITDAEARLFIEINHKHCDGEFGRDIFTQKDLVVRLSDATKFYQFLDICYRKLVSGSKTPSEKCGFIRINKESVVPYTVRNNQQVVPLFYFEGETENLKTKAELLNGWDLAYLKFCCKVQGIRNELFSSENVAVISLTDIKSYFPNGTEFEDYWPSKVVDSNLLIGNRANVNNSVNWTRQPSAPPPKITNSVGVNSSAGAGSGNSGSAGPQKSQQQHSNAVSAAAAQQQHLLKQRAAAAAAAAASANGVATAGNFPSASAAAAAAAAFNSQAATAAAAAAAAMLQTQGNTRILNQALANAGWMNSQNNVPHLHAQMLQQTHANANRTYRDISHISNMMLSGNTRQTYPYNNPAISMSTVNSQSGGNAPPPLVRSAAGQNANHMSNVEQSLVQQQQTQQQQQRQHQNSTFNNHAQHSPNTHSPRSHHGHVLAKINSNNNSRNPSLTTTNNSTRGGNSCSPNAASASAAAAAAAAVAANMHALLGSSFNYNMPSTRADYTNLALWNQLTPAERLLFTQQIKGAGIGLAVGGVGLRGGSGAGGAGSATGSGSGSSSASQKSHGNFPSLPSLPLDTDLITMLDYNNPNKQQQASVKSTKAAVVASSSNSSGGGGATFTKPTVPALISDEQQQHQQQQHNQQQQLPISKRHRGGGPGGAGVTTIPLNSTQALEDFEKKFNMTDEMRAVIHKVLANPDLSTSIQTNANNHNNNSNNNPHPVPSYISPPMSPAIGANVTTLSLSSNPNVTITPQLPGHFLHSPSSSCSSSSASTTAASPLGSASVNSIGVGGAGASTGSGGGVAARQKSVICSTKTNSLPLAILSLASGSGRGGVNGASTGVGVGSQRHKRNSSVYGRQSHSHQFSIGSHLEGIGSTTITPSPTPTDVIDLSSSRRSLAASAFHQQQQQQQQQAAAAAQQQQQQAAATQHQRMTAALAHHAQHMQNGSSSSGRSVGGSSSGSSSANGGGSSNSSGSGGTSSGAGGNSSSSAGGGGSGSNSSSNSASLHLQRHAALAHAAAASTSDGAQRLCIIPEIPTSSMNLTPYKVQRVCVDKHLVPCINMKAYNDSEQLMTLTEFQKNFFPTVALDHCKRLIEALGVELYKANRRQVQILMEYDRSYNENMPLVQVRDIIKYMTQLTFMTRQSEQPPSKRTRTS